MKDECPVCGKRHAKFPRKCAHEYDFAVMHTVILLSGTPIEGTLQERVRKHFPRMYPQANVESICSDIDRNEEVEAYLARNFPEGDGFRRSK